MASSNIKLFDENKGNMLSDSEFSISNQRLNGLQTGVASSQLQNKAMYQASLVAYAIAQVMMQNGLNANDTDAVSTFVANLSGTMLQKVYDLATTAEAQAGVATGKWMSPALVKAAIDTLAAKAQNVLSDTTKALYGLDSSAVPNDAFVEIMRKLSEKVNPNLLDNWYFGNPVNQRGITASWTSDYGPDRWIAYTAINAEISSNGLTLHTTGDGTTGVIAQILEEYLFNEIAGKVCTFSVLFADGTMRSASVQVNSSGTTLFINDYPDFGQVYLGSPNHALQMYFTQERTIKAVKLELGSQQTLAHQDSSGNWVLNEIPDYGEQLLRCQRYFQTFATESLRHTDALDFRPVMRTNPALSTITVDGKTLYTASCDYL